MTGQKSKFKILDEAVTGQVKFGDGSMVEIKGKGTVTLMCKTGEERELQEVFYIPSLCNNIISLGQLSENGNRVVLNGEYLWVYDCQGMLLMKVKRSANRLYKVIIESGESKCLMSRTSENAWTWHSRLGHVNFKVKEMMAANNMVVGFPKIVSPEAVCLGFLMSKQARKLFPGTSKYSASRILELVHSDICGPITPSTHAGNKYFLLLVDDYSHFMWAYLLENKDEAFDGFKKFKAKVESGTDKKNQSI